jgi:hypothetical protein
MALNNKPHRIANRYHYFGTLRPQAQSMPCEKPTGPSASCTGSISNLIRDIQVGPVTFRLFGP